MPPKARFVSVDTDCYLYADGEYAYANQVLNIKKGTTVQAKATLSNAGETGILSFWVKDLTTGEWLGGQDKYVRTGDLEYFTVEFTPDWVDESHEIGFYACHKEDTVPYIDERLKEDYGISFRVYVSLPEPFFDVIGITIYPDPPIVNESCTIRATIKNTGGAGTKSVDLYIDEVRKAGETLYIDSGDTRTVDFTYTFTSTETYTVEIRTEDDRFSTSVTPVLEEAIIVLDATAIIGYTGYVNVQICENHPLLGCVPFTIQNFQVPVGTTKTIKLEKDKDYRVGAYLTDGISVPCTVNGQESYVFTATAGTHTLRIEEKPMEIWWLSPLCRILKMDTAECLDFLYEFSDIYFVGKTVYCTFTHRNPLTGEACYPEWYDYPLCLLALIPIIPIKPIRFAIKGGVEAIAKLAKVDAKLVDGIRAGLQALNKDDTLTRLFIRKALREKGEQADFIKSLVREKRTEEAGREMVEAVYNTGKMVDMNIQIGRARTALDQWIAKKADIITKEGFREDEWRKVLAYLWDRSSNFGQY